MFTIKVELKFEQVLAKLNGYLVLFAESQPRG
jgi:hypothetical protein